MATQQEVLEIVTGFLLNAPPGEFLDVVQDVRKLLADETLLNFTALPTFREYNTDHMIQVTVPGATPHQMLITKDGEVSFNEYIDHKANQVVIFDHIKQQVTGQRPIRAGEIRADGEQTRAALNAALDRYIANHHAYGTGVVYCRGAGDRLKYVICISSGAFQPYNYWNGRWRSRYEIVDINESLVQLDGCIKMQIHYYENGNVQMGGEFPVSTRIQVPSSIEELGEAIIKAIVRIEADYQQNLNTSYETLGDTTFKALRRILPITRTKIDWPKLQNYKIGANIADYTME